MRGTHLVPVFRQNAFRGRSVTGRALSLVAENGPIRGSSMSTQKRAGRRRPTALDFFAGSGLVSYALEPEFEVIWANDNCSKKAAVYRANHAHDGFLEADVAEISGNAIPSADLAWASFPCQDLSLAGNMSGIGRETRSGVFWHWLRILDELRESNKKPKILVAENVVGFLVADDSAHFRAAYRAIRDLGYRAGCLVIDAKDFLPQSRPRAFLVAVSDETDIEGFCIPAPCASSHPTSLMRAARAVADSEWVWWALPPVSARKPTLASLCERSAEWDSQEKTSRLIAMLSDRNRMKLDAALRARGRFVGTGYKRTRPDKSGRRVQRLEIRFDGVAGCLRTPEGGSSRQVVVAVENGEVRSRLLTVRECARLMGAPDTYALPGSYNDGYRAMGDAVAVPVVRWLVEHLILPLAGKRGTIAA